MERRTILVTGGAGHVGSHVIEALVANPANRVISLDNYSNGTIKNHIRGAVYRNGHSKDIREHVPETPDIVYHLGEYARIKPSLKDVSDVYDRNIVGTFSVVEFCRQRKSKLVYAASSTKFAPKIRSSSSPTNTWVFRDPYSFTKATNVDLINGYGHWYKESGFRDAICYFYNAFGPREKSDEDMGTLIAKCERKYLAKETLVVHGDGRQRRAFTYVKDLAKGMILAGESGDGDGYAFAAKEQYSVLQIAEAFGLAYELRPEEFSGRQESAEDPASAERAAGLGWKSTLDVMAYIRSFPQRTSRAKARRGLRSSVKTISFWNIGSIALDVRLPA